MAEGMSEQAALEVAPFDPRDSTLDEIKELLASNGGELTPTELRALIALEEQHEKYDGGRNGVLTPLGDLLKAAPADGEGPCPFQPLYTAKPGDRVLVDDGRGMTCEAVLVDFEQGAIVRLRDVHETELFVRFKPKGGAMGWREEPPKEKPAKS